MTVGTEACGPTELSWTGVESSFAAGFVAYETSQVVVGYRNAGGAVSTLTLGVHYTVTLTGGPPGAVAVIPAAMPAAPGTVIIVRVTPAVQGVDFNDLASYSADVHEKIGDLGAMRDAEARAHALWRDLDDTYSAGGRRILSVGNPVSGADAVNLDFMNNASASVLAQVLAVQTHVDTVAAAIDAALLALGALTGKLVDIEVVIGQSNAAGNAHPISPGVYGTPTVPGSFKWRSGSIQTLADPTGGSDFGSLWPSYCSVKTTIDGVPKLVVNVAVGSTNLADSADPGVNGSTSSGHWRPGGTLLTNAFAAYDAARAAITGIGYSYTVRRVFWNILIGETDAGIWDAISGVGSPSPRDVLIQEHKAGLLAVKGAILVHCGAETRFQVWELGTSDLGDSAGFAAVRQAQNDQMSVRTQMPEPLCRIVSRWQKDAYQMGWMETGELHFNYKMAIFAGELGGFASATGINPPFALRRDIFGEPAAVQTIIGHNKMILFGYGTEGPTFRFDAHKSHAYELHAYGVGHAHDQEFALVDGNGTSLLALFDQLGTLKMQGVLQLAVSTTARPSLLWNAGALPTSPLNGYGAFDGTHYQVRLGGAWVNLDN